MPIAILAAGALGAASGYMGAKNANKVSKQQQAQIEQTRGQVQGNLESGIGAFEPYNTGGQQAFNVFNAFSGAQGPEAQKAAYESFTGGPYLGAMQTNASDALKSQMAASGYGMGGNAMNALFGQNAGLWNNALNQQMNWLNQSAQTGLGAAGGMGSLYSNANNALVGLSGQSNAAIGGQQSPMAAVLGSAAKAIGGMGSGSMGNLFGGGGTQTVSQQLS